jgi:hypothetical protein
MLLVAPMIILTHPNQGSNAKFNLKLGIILSKLVYIGLDRCMNFG